MELTTKGKFYLAILFASLAISYFVIPLNYFPYLGFSLSFAIFWLLSYLIKKEKTRETTTYLALAVIFAAFLTIRSEHFVTFLNFIASFYFGSLMLMHNKFNSTSLLERLFSPAFAALYGVATKSEYFLEQKSPSDQKKFNKSFETAAGIIVTAIVLVIVVPLLAFSNPIFNNYLLEVWRLTNLENFFKDINLERLFIWSVRAAFFLTLAFFLPRIISFVNKSQKLSLPVNIDLSVISFKIPKIVLSLVLLLFLFSQIQLYFASEETLKALSLTHSQRTREVFGQLSVVAGIVLFLLYNDTKRKSKLLDILLGLLGFFLIFIAFKSAIDYINAWGLTYARLYGLTFATWLTGIFAIYFLEYQMKVLQSQFIRTSILYTSLVLVLVNILNFDYLIYNFSKASTGRGVDYGYLATLSADSMSYKDHYEKLQSVTNEGTFASTYADNPNPQRLLFSIEYLQRKYNSLDIRTFNLMEYMQYKAVKDIKLQELFNIYIYQIPAI